MREGSKRKDYVKRAMRKASTGLKLIRMGPKWLRDELAMKRKNK